MGGDTYFKKGPFLHHKTLRLAPSGHMAYQLCHVSHTKPDIVISERWRLSSISGYVHQIIVISSPFVACHYNLPFPIAWGAAVYTNEGLVCKLNFDPLFHKVYSLGTG